MSEPFAVDALEVDVLEPRYELAVQPNTVGPVLQLAQAAEGVVVTLVGELRGISTCLLP